MRTSVLHTVLAVALVVGTACKGPDSLDTVVDNYQAVARGANVVPLPTDTTPRAVVNIVTNTTANTVAWSYSVSTLPAGTIDSIALYQVAAGAALPSTGTGATLTAGNATAILCAGAAACVATSGTATLVGATTTATTIRTSMRGYGTQVVFFTTVAQYQVSPGGVGKALVGGAIRGTLYPNPPL